MQLSYHLIATKTLSTAACTFIYNPHICDRDLSNCRGYNIVRHTVVIFFKCYPNLDS